ncbi:MAG TPA: hypothetical protein PLO63_10765 [Syntrophales bacterium]|nr:hypothetical protein [Syntrophales bacterium]
MCSWPLRGMLVLAGAALLWFGVAGLRSGVVRVKGGRWIGRQESPLQYWLFVGTYFITGAGGILFAVFAGFVR